MSKQSNAAMLKRARPRSEPFTVLLDFGDGAVDAYNDMVRDLDGTPEGPERESLAERIATENERLRDEQTFEGRLKVLPPLTWESLKAEHPPREGNEDDAVAGVDKSHAADIVRACLLDWEPSDEEWAHFVECAGAGEVDLLLDKVLRLHTARGSGWSIPKLPSDFLRTQGRRSA